MFVKAFFRDRLILLFSFVAGLLTCLNLLLVIWRVDLVAQSSTILRYWTVYGVPEFEKQSPEQLYSFAIFAVGVLLLGVFTSQKLYSVYRPAAYAVLVLSQVVLLANLLTSNAILNLQQ